MNNNTSHNQNALLVRVTYLKQRLRRVRQHQKNTLLRHDNGRPHTARNTVEASHRLPTPAMRLPHFSKTEGEHSWTLCDRQPDSNEGVRRAFRKDLDEETKCWRSCVTCLRNVSLCHKCVWRIVEIMWKSTYRW